MVIISGNAFPAEPAVDFQKTLLIEVPGTSAREVTESVRLADGVAEPLGGDGLNWNPTEDLKPLTCSSTGEKLAIGRSKSDPVYVEYSHAKLRQSEPGKLTVGLSRPELLNPGVYVGEVTSRLWHADPERFRECRVKWQVVVAVHGRRLLDTTFSRKAAGQPLRVGKPASVRFKVYTVGCELGNGVLKLDQSDGKSQATEVALLIHLPFDNVIDPLSAFATDESQHCHPQWRDSPMYVNVVEHDVPAGVVPTASRQKQVKAPTQRMYDVEFVGPDCYLPGQMQAHVKWEQSPRSAASVLSASTGLEEVRSGINTFPRVCFVNERVQVSIRSTTDLGNTFNLVVSGPQRQPFKPVRMERRQTAEVGGVDPYHEYQGEFWPPTLGSYQLGWPKDSSVLQLNLEEPATLEVPFEGNNNLADQIEVFASATPVYWPLNPNPNKGGGYMTRRIHAMAFGYSPRYLRKATLRQSGLFRQAADGQLGPYRPDREPEIQVSLGEATFPGDKPAKWELPNKGWLAFDLLVSVHPRIPAGHPRHQRGVLNYVWRGLVEGEDINHRPVARICRGCFQVKVSTDWEYHLTILIVALSFVAVGGAILLVRHLTLRPYSRPKPKHRAMNNVESEMTPESEEDALFDRPVVDVSPAVADSNLEARTKPPTVLKPPPEAHRHADRQPQAEQLDSNASGGEEENEFDIFNR